MLAAMSTCISDEDRRRFVLVWPTRATERAPETEEEFDERIRRAPVPASLLRKMEREKTEPER